MASLLKKFPIAAKLQTFQYRILAAREILRIGAVHDVAPGLFGGNGHAFEVLHYEALFAIA